MYASQAYSEFSQYFREVYKYMYIQCSETSQNTTETNPWHVDLIREC
jgi:hypothetical protein